MNRVLIDDVAEILNGFAFDSDYFNTTGNGLPIVRIRDVVPGFSETYYSGDFPEGYILQNGDLLIGMDGEFNIANWKGGKALLNQRVCKVTPKSGIADASFLKHRLAVVLKEIEANTPFVTVKHLSSENLKQTETEMPPLPEQRRIAALLDKADHLRCTRRYAEQLSDTFLQAVFVRMFGDPVRNEMGWEIRQLEEIVQPERGVTYGIVQAGPHVANGIPYIKTGDIVDGTISPFGLSRTSVKIAGDYRRSEVKFGDIVFSIRATVGTCALLPRELDGANLTQGTARIAPGSEVNQFYLLWMLRSTGMQRWFQQQVKGSTFFEITLTRLRETPVLIPPLALQRTFARVVQQFERLRAQQREAERQAEHLFQTLLHKAFSWEG